MIYFFGWVPNLPLDFNGACGFRLSVCKLKYLCYLLLQCSGMLQIFYENKFVSLLSYVSCLILVFKDLTVCTVCTRHVTYSLNLVSIL